MAMGYVQALAVLHRTFVRSHVGKRAYVLGRFLTCPFLAVVDAIPTGARVLDIGAGHGVLARLAAEHGAARVVALEPDLRKSLPSFRHPGVAFVAGFDETLAGSFDAVTVIDVLYKVPFNQWDALLGRIRERLVPGGTVLLKELDPEHGWKNAWNRAQEHLANALNLTLGRSFSYENRRQLEARLVRLGFVDFQARDIGRWYPHAHVLYTARRAAP
jgi:2-polyprenyl-3-methyl-5-hydroxy-6-metoxy-1,4-benzoquinol methylase